VRVRFRTASFRIAQQLFVGVRNVTLLQPSPRLRSALFSQQVNTNRSFQFHKRRQRFIRTHNETLSAVAMRVSNAKLAWPSRSTVETRPF
jgi:hypothetical protein